MLFTVPNYGKVISWELPRPPRALPPPCISAGGRVAGRLAVRGNPTVPDGARCRGAEPLPSAAGGEPLPAGAGLAAGPAPPPAGRRGRLPLRRRPDGTWDLSQQPHINRTPGKDRKCIVPKRMVPESCPDPISICRNASFGSSSYPYERKG